MHRRSMSRANMKRYLISNVYTRRRNIGGIGMITHWILQILAGTVVGCAIGYFLTRIINKLRVFLFRKQSNKYINDLDQDHIKRFYNIFGFYYEDVIKYAPELDTFILDSIPQSFKDNIDLKMIKMRGIYDAICTVEQIDIIKFKQTIENIKNQKALENID